METPELNKMQANRDKSQPIGGFLDWPRNEQDISLCVFDEDNPAYDDDDNEIAVYHSVNKTTEQLLADYFGINLNKAEKERQALLDEIRAANAKTD